MLNHYNSMWLFPSPCNSLHKFLLNSFDFPIIVVWRSLNKFIFTILSIIFQCTFSEFNTKKIMEQPMGDLRSQLMGSTSQSDGEVFKTVLYYSVLILLLPIGSFFVTKSIIFETVLGQARTSLNLCWEIIIDWNENV